MKSLRLVQKVPETKSTVGCGHTTVPWSCAFSFPPGSMGRALLDKTWHEFSHLSWLSYIEVLQNNPTVLCGVRNLLYIHD